MPEITIVDSDGFGRIDAVGEFGLGRLISAREDRIVYAPDAASLSDLRYVFDAAPNGSFAGSPAGYEGTVGVLSVYSGGDRDFDAPAAADSLVLRVSDLAIALGDLLLRPGDDSTAEDSVVFAGTDLVRANARNEIDGRAPPLVRTGPDLDIISGTAGQSDVLVMQGRAADVLSFDAPSATQGAELTLTLARRRADPGDTDGEIAADGILRADLDSVERIRFTEDGAEFTLGEFLARDPVARDDGPDAPGTDATSDLLIVAEGDTTGDLVARLLANDSSFRIDPADLARDPAMAAGARVFENGRGVREILDLGDTEQKGTLTPTSTGSGADARIASLTFTADGQALDSLGLDDSGQPETETVTFSYRLADGGASDADPAPETGEVSVRVVGVNDPPVAVDDGPLETDEAQALTFDVLANDTDVEGDDITVVQVAGETIEPGRTITLTTDADDPQSIGSVSLLADGRLEFDPGDDFLDLRNGEKRDVAFTYVIEDEHGGSLVIPGEPNLDDQNRPLADSEATVRITINGKGEVPRLENPPGDDCVAIGETVVLDLSEDFADVFEDPDGKDVTLSVSGLPDWLDRVGETDRYIGTPTAGDFGDTAVTLTGTDVDGAQSVDFDLQVRNPIPSLSVDPADLSVEEGEAVTFTLSLDTPELFHDAIPFTVSIVEGEAENNLPAFALSPQDPEQKILFEAGQDTDLTDETIVLEVEIDTTMVSGLFCDAEPDFEAVTIPISITDTTEPPDENGTGTVTGGGGTDVNEFFGEAADLLTPAPGFDSDLFNSALPQMAEQMETALERVTGTQADDLFEGGPSGRLIDALGGRDTVAYAHARAEIGEAVGADGRVTIAGPAGRLDVLEGVERVALEDGLYLYDLGGEAAAVHRLFTGALGRLPQEAGLRHWTGEAEDGASIEGLARAFLASAEGEARFGDAATDDADFVDALFSAMFERDAADQGLTYWTDELAAGASRAAVLSAFVQSEEYLDLTRDDHDDGIWVLA